MQLWIDMLTINRIESFYLANNIFIKNIFIPSFISMNAIFFAIIQFSKKTYINKFIFQKIEIKSFNKYIMNQKLAFIINVLIILFEEGNFQQGTNSLQVLKEI